MLLGSSVSVSISMPSTLTPGLATFSSQFLFAFLFAFDSACRSGFCFKCFRILSAFTLYSFTSSTISHTAITPIAIPARINQSSPHLYPTLSSASAGDQCTDCINLLFHSPCFLEVDRINHACITRSSCVSFSLILDISRMDGHES